MSTSGVSKLSGLKPPSKIARPTSLNHDGIHSSVKKLSSDVGKTKLNDDHNTVLTEDTDKFIVGDRVWVGGTKPGVIAFIGETQFGPGDWAGIVLDEPIGKNDGSVAGIRYFQCGPNRGVFSRLTRLTCSPVDPSQVTTPRSNGTPTPVTPEGSIHGSTYSQSSIKTPAGSFHPPPDLKLDDRVIVKSSYGSKAGILRYYGTTEFGAGVWCGVELDDPSGKNDGSVNGIRYFDCAPKFGLFVPADKVSRSPISYKKGTACIIHPGGLSRQGSQDSFRSISSIATTTASSIKSNPRVRLGVNSLHQKPRSSVTPTRPVQSNSAKSPPQAELKEKEAYIQQLIKEKEMERREMIRAATQADEVEKKYNTLKEQYNKIFTEKDLQQTSLMCVINKLEKQKSELQNQLDENSKKIEDLQFSCEEESLSKSEVEAINEEYKEKLEKLEKMVSSKSLQIELPNTEDNTSISEITDESTISNRSDKDLHIDQLNQTINKLTKEKEELQALKQSRDIIFEELENTLNNATISLSEKENLLTQIITKNENLMKRVSELEVSKMDLQNQIQDHQSKASILECDTINQFLKNICSKMDRLNSKIADTVSGHISVNEAIKNLDHVRDEQQSLITDAIFKSEFTKVNDTVSELANKIDNLINNSITCLQQINTLSENVGKKDEEIFKILEEKTKLKKEYEEYDTAKQLEIKNMEMEYSNLLKVKENLEDQLKSSNDNIKKLEELFSNKDQSSKLEIENIKSILQDKISEYEQLSTEFVGKINHLSDEIIKKDEQTSDNLKKQQKIIEELNINFEETVYKLNVTIAEKEKIQEEFTDYKMMKESEIENLKQITEKLTNKTSNLETLLNEKVSTIAETDEKLADIAVLKLSLNTKTQEYEDCCKIYEDKIDKLNKDTAIRGMIFNEIKNKFCDLLNTLALQDDANSVTITDNFDIIEKFPDSTPEVEIVLRDLTKTWKEVASSLVNQISNLKQTAKDAKDALSNTDKIIMEYDIQLRTLTEEKTQMCDRLEDLQNTYLALKLSYNELNNFNAELQCQIQELTENFNSLTKEKENFKLQSETHLNRYEEVRQKLSQLDNEKSESHAVKELLKEEYLSLKQEKGSLEEKMISNEKLIAYLNDEVTKKQNEIGNMEIKLLNSEKEFKDILECLKMLNEQVEISRQQKLENDGENKTLREQLVTKNKILEEIGKNHENDLRRMEDQLKSLSLEKEKHDVEFVKLSNQLKATNEILNNLQADTGIKTANDLHGTSNGRSDEHSSFNNASYEKLVEDKEQTEQQVHFLNSVIVDMQHKNENLLEKIRYLESIVGSSEIVTNCKPRIATPRMFCDICDVFDQHETEDCPEQSNITPPTSINHGGTKAKQLDRPYCDNCEMFGHDTSKCNEDETF